MSIIKGDASGQLAVSANLLPSYAHTIYLWVKEPAGSGVYLRYATYTFNATDSRTLAVRNHGDGYQIVTAFGYTNSATDPGAVTNDSWVKIASHGNETDKYITLRTPNGTFSQETAAYTTFPAIDTPSLVILEGSAFTAGTKIGGILICDAELSEAQLSALDAGTLDPPTIPDMVEYWSDQSGVADDGSGNLTSWTGANGTVLIPTGTVTIDNTDLAPIVGGEPTDTTHPLIDSSAVVVDGGTVTIVFDENVDVGVGGNGGFTVTATYGNITLTPTTTLPASTVAFTPSRTIENGETLGGVYTQPGDGFEDESGNDLESTTFSITNNSKVHKIFSDASKTTPYTTAGVIARVLDQDLTDAVAPQTVDPDVSGYVQLTESLASGTYTLVATSSDGSLNAIGEHVVP